MPRVNSLVIHFHWHIVPTSPSGSYGFVLRHNPHGALDYWVKVPPADPGFAWKQALLDEHTLTARQAYDFSGTLRAGGDGALRTQLANKFPSVRDDLQSASRWWGCSASAAQPNAQTI